MKMIDLSMTIKEHWRWNVQHEIVQDFQEGSDFRSSTIAMSAHAYTHVDTPLHCRENETTMEELEVDAYSGEAAVIDLSSKKADEAITVADLEANHHVKLNEKIILLKTCWDTQYSPYTKEYWIKAPYLTEEAAIWLKNKRPKVVGFDFPQDYPMKLIDSGGFKLKEMVTHQHLLYERILLIEYLCNLSEIKENRVQITCLPLKFSGLEGAPARVVAMV